MTGVINSNNLSVNIMMLNDECLNHIVRYLEHPDRFNFALTCSRLLNFYKHVSPELDKSLNLHYFNSNDAIYFMKLFGGNVKEIQGLPEVKSKVYDVLDTYCINLNSIYIRGDLEFKNITEIFPKLNYLQELHIIQCNFNYNFELTSDHFPQLEILDLSYCKRPPYQLPNSIKSLKLSGCFDYDWHNVLQLCKLLPQLKELNVEMVSIRESDFQKMISENWFELLESLKISIEYRDKEYEHIAKLPSLKKLVVDCFEIDYDILKYKPVPQRLLMMLVEHKSKQLEHFSIISRDIVDSSTISFISKLIALRVLGIPNNKGIGNAEMEQLHHLQELEEIDLSDCPNITNDSVLRLILACPKLRVLHLKLCSQLTKELLTNVILNLDSQRTAQRMLPIKIYMTTDAELRSLQQFPNIYNREIIDLKLKF